jgi:putative nucleotidyltransferase with HDIG domain
VADQRHSIEVARRFSAILAEAQREDMAAALLHDVGKLASGLGTFARVAATLVGPRSGRLRQYHDHERLGAEMLRTAGSSPETIALVANTSLRGDVAAALRHADHV